MKDKCYELLIFLVIALFVFASCKNAKRISDLPILKISYLKGNTERILPVKCGEIMNFQPMEFKLDTNIFDRKLITKIETLTRSLDELPNNLHTGCDVKIDCLLKFTNSDSIKLCIGDFNCIIKDGQLMKKNDTLLYLIRRYSGYYNFFTVSNLKYFEELRYFGIPEDYKYYK